MLLPFWLCIIIVGFYARFPVIGGKELNLHVLYGLPRGEVMTSTDKKWRDIVGIFDFSPTTTSASYALRKRYFSLLFNFEQAYFLQHHYPHS
ncbi:high mobility group B 9, partial [Olea europaea subsp. europaea]